MSNPKTGAGSASEARLQKSETGGPASAPPEPAKLSAQLAGLERRLGGGPTSLGALMDALHTRAYTLVIILFALPFLTPLPLPGLSTPFGLVIALVGVQLAWGARPWLPAGLRSKRLPPGFLARLMRVAARIIGWLESVLKARWGWVFAAPGSARVHALLIVAAAIVLLLPLPLPLTNTFPAWVIVLAACGLLERDGLIVALAYLVAILGVAYFVLLGEAAHHTLRYFFGHLWA